MVCSASAVNPVLPGPINGNPSVKEAVCISTRRVYDSCRESDCLEDLEVSLTDECQALIDRATSVRFRSAEIVWVSTDIEPISFNRGYFTVDIKFYYKITAEVFIPNMRPTIVEGLVTFEKKVILCGSEGTAHIFSSMMKTDENDFQLPCKTNLPIAVVEVVDPVPLNIRIAEVADERDCCPSCCVPNCVACCFPGPVSPARTTKRLYVSLGQYSIIKLERESQLLIPVYDFCIPANDCSAVSSGEDPCALFRSLSFPVDSFFPPACD